uniref:Uncharacterized protein n=1 Tax=Candidatus Kentrum sp. LPFa TaxID=2126335 RepID=A0A450XZ66_9GAMM|nr:MAG: hypothetical protein BECKLPF1236A_GA0070988_102813 [Candidatus Kentron sp. LPFa]VFK34582.1 MAG: hypothetical protein BECKLPF1236C_GA0070990_102824 [Candidatus Kentron sp. LPFa]
MALDPVPASAGMTYPCRDDGIVEFEFDFQLGVKIPDSCIKGPRQTIASRLPARNLLTTGAEGQ